MNTPILESAALSKTFALRSDTARPGASRLLKAVDQVSLALLQGETLGIAGESGCGKSTLARMLTGLLAPDSGTINFQGHDLNSLTPEQRTLFRRSVQMIFQDPFSSLNPRIRIGDAIAEPIVIHNLAPRHDVRQRATKLMDQVGLSADLYDRFPHEFSGGQRQRIGIARALAVEPTILVADEPVSSLDISIQAQIINLLQELKAQHGLTLAIISHDLGVLRHMCDRIAVMYLGAIVELAPTSRLFERCRHPYTEALLAAIPSMHAAQERSCSRLPNDLPSPASGIPGGCRFHPRCAYTREICRLQSPDLVEQSAGHRAACHRSAELFNS